MIMIRLMGGLGNQMFQYAFGRALSLRYNVELVLDQTLLLDKSSEHKVTTHRDYDLDIFKNLKFRWASTEEVIAFNGDKTAGPLKKIIRKINNVLFPKKLVIQQGNSISPNYFEVQGDTCFVGRWQSYIFFKNFEFELRKDFHLEQPQITGLNTVLDQIKTCESVCLHVRRGDLITSPVYTKTIGALDNDYYSRAIEKISKSIKDPVFFIFSEDIEWCKQNINPGKKHMFIEPALSGKKAEGHFFLMKSCRHFIISNSTYAWWSAFLSENKDKLVIYPSNWFKEKKLSNPGMSPHNWVSI